MSIFLDRDILAGSGAFDQVMRSQSIIPGESSNITPGLAVGILSAAMRSGLPEKIIGDVIETYYPGSATLLKRVLSKFEGNDWSMDLWHLLPSGRYKLCTELCRPGLAQWRYTPNAVNA